MTKLIISSSQAIEPEILNVVDGLARIRKTHSGHYIAEGFKDGEWIVITDFLYSHLGNAQRECETFVLRHYGLEALNTVVVWEQVRKPKQPQTTTTNTVSQKRWYQFWMK